MSIGTYVSGYSLLQRKISGQSFSIVLCYMLILGVCAGWLTSLSKVSLLLSFAICVIGFVGSSEICCRLIFVCFPFFNVMGADLGGTSLFYLIVLSFVLKATLDGSIENLHERYGALAAVIVLTIYNFGAGLIYVKWLFHLTVPLLLLGTTRFEKYFPIYVRLLTISLVFSGAMGLLMMERGIYLYTFGTVNTGIDVTTRFSGLIGDAVVFGQVIALVVGANVYLLYAKASYRGSFLLSITLVFFAFLTYSKAALICLVIVGASALFSFVRRAIQEGLPISYLIGGLLVLLFAYYFAIFLLSGSSLFSVDALTTRLDSGDLLTARKQIWSAYFGMWDSIGVPMLFKGIGFDTYLGTTVYGRWHNCHNIYIEAVTLFGWILSLILIAVLAAHFIRKYREGASLLSYLPGVLLLSSGLILHGFLDFPFFYEWTVALGCIDYSVTLSENRIGSMGGE